MSKAPIIEQLKWRAAVKKYDPTKKLTEEQINTLLEAANLSPSAYGLQPYRFYVVSDDKTKAAMAEVVYIPLGVLVAAASTLEIDSSPMQGFNPEALDALLGIDKDGFKSGAVVAVGYRSPEDVWSTWNKTRKPFNEIVKMVAV
jgi:nitroreductase